MEVLALTMHLLAIHIGYNYGIELMISYGTKYMLHATPTNSQRSLGYQTMALSASIQPCSVPYPSVQWLLVTEEKC